MKELIDGILLIIQEYREDDLTLDSDHIYKWINQFEEEDREFLLQELLHILPKSYLSKERTLKILSDEFETLRRDFNYESVEDFLNETKILDCQAEAKSQKVLIEIIRQILHENYNYDLDNCGSKGIKNWIYFDDVLASGGTFREDIVQEIEEYGVEEFKKSKIKIIASFFILHTWAKMNVVYALQQKLDFQIGKIITFYRVATIDNYPKVNYYNQSPRFNHVYPLESEEGKKYLEFLETAYERDYDLRNAEFAFRNPNLPEEETFYSNSANRKRYEEILLAKGIEIIYSINHSYAKSLRPLGMTPPSFKTLGTGSHFFTWRNISNTCPIVFWWEANGWHPLFPVVNRG